MPRRGPQRTNSNQVLDRGSRWASPRQGAAKGWRAPQPNPLFLQQGVNCRLHDGLVNLRLGAAGRHAADRALRRANSTVLRGAPSAFCRKRRLPLSSTMQRLTSTFRLWASASAAETMVLMAARLSCFLDGRSVAKVSATRARIAVSCLSMPRMLPIARAVCQVEGGA
jgi:hypothetical protein